MESRVKPLLRPYLSLLILLPDTGKEDPNQIKRMIYEVNKEHVAPEEILSYSLYYYERKGNRVRLI